MDIIIFIIGLVLFLVGHSKVNDNSADKLGNDLKTVGKWIMIIIGIFWGIAFCYGILLGLAAL